MGEHTGRLRMELFVEDQEVSAEFYERVLGFATLRVSEDYRPVRRGDVVIGIGRVDRLPTGDGPGFTQERVRAARGAGVEIVLEVDGGPDAVDALHEHCVSLGVPVAEPPQDRPWGLRDFRLSDPDGYYWRVTHGDARDEGEGSPS